MKPSPHGPDLAPLTLREPAAHVEARPARLAAVLAELERRGPDLAPRRPAPAPDALADTRSSNLSETAKPDAPSRGIA